MDGHREVTALLDRAVADLNPRVDVLVSGAAARGRVLRRRRRATQAGSGLGLVGLIAAVVVAVWPSGASAPEAPAGSSPRSSQARPHHDRPKSCRQAGKTRLAEQCIAVREAEMAAHARARAEQEQQRSLERQQHRAPGH